MAAIDPAALAACCRRLGIVEIRHVVETSSTNDDVRALARAGAPHGTALVAERQTAGRGRLGRRWLAVDGGAVLLSVLVRPRLRPVQAPLLALAAAVGVAVTLGEGAAIKWPNDVLDREGRKLAGILAELESSEPMAAVIGIGVNATASPDLPTAGFLAADGRHVDRAALAAQLVRAVLDAVETLERDPGELLDQWRSRAAHRGALIEVAGRRGRMIDVDVDGALLLDAPEGRIRILTGDVALLTRTTE